MTFPKGINTIFLTLSIFLCLTQISVSQIKKDIPGKINPNLKFYEITNNDSTKYLLLKGRTRITLYPIADSTMGNSAKKKGRLQHISTKGVYIYNDFVSWKDIDHIKFKPHRNRNGRFLVAYYSVLIGFGAYAIYDSYISFDIEPLIISIALIPAALIPLPIMAATQNKLPVRLIYKEGVFYRKTK
jgi:hypothetical protein